MGFQEKNNEYVVYPGYGVAIIEKEIKREINSSQIIFSELKFLNKDMTILVPKENFENIGIRCLSSLKQMEDIFGIFDFEYPEDWLQNICMISWNRRSKEYQNKIRVGKLTDIATIYRDLKYIEIKKGLSFGEKTVLSQVEFLLCEELAILNNSPLELTIREVKIYIETLIKGYEEITDNFFSINFLNKKYVLTGKIKNYN